MTTTSETSHEGAAGVHWDLTPLRRLPGRRPRSPRPRPRAIRSLCGAVPRDRCRDGRRSAGLGARGHRQDRERRLTGSQLRAHAPRHRRHQRGEPRPVRRGRAGRRRDHEPRPVLRAGVAGAVRRARGRAGRRARGGARPPLPDLVAPLRPAHADRTRGAGAGRARPGRQGRLAVAVPAADLHHRGAVRRRRGRAAAYGRPAAGVRPPPRPPDPAGGARHALRGAGAEGAGRSARLRLAGRRPAGDRPPAQLRRRPDGANPSRKRARPGRRDVDDRRRRA